jgi:hypothetical protein
MNPGVSALRLDAAIIDSQPRGAPVGIASIGDIRGNDVSEAYVRGAERALMIGLRQVAPPPF